jgi:hypothetical protein
MSTLEIKIDGFPSSEKRTNEQNQELAKKLSSAISAVLGFELSLDGADSYEENGRHKVSVELSPKSYNDRVKVKFGSGDRELEFTFTGWDIYRESAFETIVDSGCYSDTGGGWRDTYRRLFAPLAAEYLREPKYIEQRAEFPHFSFEPV